MTNLEKGKEASLKNKYIWKKIKQVL